MSGVAPNGGFVPRTTPGVGPSSSHMPTSQHARIRAGMGPQLQPAVGMRPAVHGASANTLAARAAGHHRSRLQPDIRRANRGMDGSNGPAPQYRRYAEQETHHRELHDAVWRNDALLVRGLLASGADPNVQNPSNGTTALHLAATCGYIDIAHALAADPRTRDRPVSGLRAVDKAAVCARQKDPSGTNRLTPAFLDFFWAIADRDIEDAPLPWHVGEIRWAQQLLRTNPGRHTELFAWLEWAGRRIGMDPITRYVETSGRFGSTSVGKKVKRSAGHSPLKSDNRILLHWRRVQTGLHGVKWPSRRWS